MYELLPIGFVFVFTLNVVIHVFGLIWLIYIPGSREISLHTASKKEYME